MKSCIACEHFNLDFGEADWSDITPGDSPSLNCAKKVFEEVEGQLNCFSAYAKMLKTATNCKHLKPRVLEAKRLRG